MNYCACGYCGTGSSVIYHLLSEYDGIESGNLGDYEHVLMYTPHGLFALEDALYRNNNWHNFDVAIKDFRTEMLRLARNDFEWFGGLNNKTDSQFEIILNEFIDSITQYKLNGRWSYDYKGFKNDPIQFGKDVIRKIQGHERPNPGVVLDYDTDGVIYYSFVEHEEFLAAARKFVKSYLELMYGTDENLNLNQFLVPHNLYRLRDYFGDNMRAVIVDRDPRDLYIITKYVWPLTMGFLQRFPTNVEDFITFYEGMRRSVTKYDPELVLTINFEDFIYKYDETVAKVEEFFGLDPKNHIAPKSHLNPEVSINNTQNFYIKPEWADEIKLIEEKLPQYLYNFPYKRVPRIEDTKFL